MVSQPQPVLASPWQEPPPWELLAQLASSPGRWALVAHQVSAVDAQAVAGLLTGGGLEVAARPLKSVAGPWSLWARSSPDQPAPLSQPAPAPPAVAAPAPPAARPARAWEPGPTPAVLTKWFPPGGIHRWSSKIPDRPFAVLAARFIAFNAHGITGQKAYGQWLGVSQATVWKNLTKATERGLYDVAGEAKRGTSRIGTLTPKARALLNPEELEGVPGPDAAPAPGPAVPSKAPSAPVKPTRAQAAMIARLQVGNAAHVQATRAGRGGPAAVATLPATCTPMTPRELPAYLRPWGESAVAAGWAIGRQGDGHHRWVGPQGQVCSSNATSGDRGTTRANATARLRRAGVPPPSR